MEIILVDGNSYLYRSWYAMSGLMVNGMMTNCIYGMSNLLTKLAKNCENPVVVVFDPPGRNFRHEIYKEYKANRSAMPNELKEQIPIVKDLVKGFGFYCLEVKGFEADDVIATLCKKSTAIGSTVQIASIDKDLCQLISKDVRMVDLKDSQSLGEKEVVAKFGVKPDQIVDYLSLVGDSSDNIKGIPGVGPKTAAKWLGLFGSINGIYKCLDQIPSKNVIKLKEMRETLHLNRKLISLKEDITLPDDYSDLAKLDWMGVDRRTVEAIYTKYKLITSMKKLPSLKINESIKYLPPSTTTFPDDKNKAALKEGYSIIVNSKQLLDVTLKMKEETLVSLDLETTSLNYIEAKIIGISFSWKPKSGYYVVVGKVGIETVLSILKDWFEDAQCHKSGHNLKYDANVLKNYNIDLRGIVHDSMLLCHLYGKSIGKSSLDYDAQTYLGYTTTTFDEVVGDKHSFADVDEISAANYAIEDAEVSLRLINTLSLDKAKDLYHTVEIPLISVLSSMESRGILLERKILKELSDELLADEKLLSSELFRLAGSEFNLSSPKQVGEFLYETLKCPVLTKTKGGAPSTSELVLEILAGPAYNTKAAQLLLEYRTVNKLLTTYTLPLAKLIAEDGRIHTSYHQTAVVSGRLSSSHPNLQNIPIGSSRGIRVREAFVATEGWELIGADYSQIELRMMAHLSQDPAMIKAFVQEEDIHITTASEIFNTPALEVTQEMRRAAKSINFGLIYGMGEYGLAQRLGITREQAKEYRDKYFQRFPKVYQYMENCIQNGKKNKSIHTLLGREVALAGISDSNFNTRSRSERLAINAPVQGSAAEIIKLAMLKTMNIDLIKKNAMHLLLQVHDELVFEVKKEHAQGALKQITKAMEGAYNLLVPLRASVKIGKNWKEVH